MKKCALLAGLGLVFFMSSCAKDDLVEMEKLNLELTKKDRDKPEDEWNKNFKINDADSTLHVHTLFSGGGQ